MHYISTHQPPIPGRQPPGTPPVSQLIRANYEMTKEEAVLVNGLMDKAEGDFRFYLLQMREEKGWKALGYASFDDYGVQARGLGKSRLYQLAQAAEIQLSLPNSTIVEKAPESQLRPLAPLTDNERQRVWAEATAIAEEENRKLTAKLVQQAVDRLQAEKTQLQANLELTEQRSEGWRQQSIAEKKAKTEAEQKAMTAQAEAATLRKTIAAEAKKLAAAELAAIRTEAEQAKIDKLELERKLKQLRKDQDTAVETRTRQALQAQQDDITHRELQLAALNGRIAVLHDRLDAANQQDRAVAHYTEVTKEIRRALDALSLSLSKAFDFDDASFLPAPFVPAFERLAHEMDRGAASVRNALGQVDIRQIEVAVHVE